MPNSSQNPMLPMAMRSILALPLFSSIGRLISPSHLDKTNLRSSQVISLHELDKQAVCSSKFHRFGTSVRRVLALEGAVCLIWVPREKSLLVKGKTFTFRSEKQSGSQREGFSRRALALELVKTQPTADMAGGVPRERANCVKTEPRDCVKTEPTADMADVVRTRSVQCPLDDVLEEKLVNVHCSIDELKKELTGETPRQYRSRDSDVVSDRIERAVDQLNEIKRYILQPRKTSSRRLLKSKERVDAGFGKFVMRTLIQPYVAAQSSVLCHGEVFELGKKDAKGVKHSVNVNKIIKANFGSLRKKMEDLRMGQLTKEEVYQYVRERLKHERRLLGKAKNKELLASLKAP